MANNIQFVVLGDVTDIQNKLSSLKKNFDDLTKYSAIAFTALTASAFTFIDAAQKQQLAINQLNQALKNQGNFSQETSDDLQTYAGNLANVSLFTKTSIVQAEALISSFGFQADTTKALTQATIDLAQAKGLDLVSAADLVSKSVGSSTDALSRYGITIDGAAGSTSRANSFIEASNRLFQGQALAATQGLGATVQLKNQMDELAVSVGNALAPNVLVLTTNLKSFFDTASSSNITKMVASFLTLGITITAVGLAVGVLGKSVTNLAIAWTGLNASIGLSVFANGGLNTDIMILVKNVGLLYPAVLIVGAAFAGWKLGELIGNVTGLNNALSGTSGILTKVYASMSGNQASIDNIKAQTAAALAAHNQTMAQIQAEETAKIAALKAEQAAEDAANKSKVQAASALTQFMETNATQLTAIAQTQNQTELRDLITKFDQERTAFINEQNQKLQLLKNNGQLTVANQTAIDDEIANINSRYDGLEEIANEQLQNKLNTFQQKGLDIYKQTQADQLGTLTTTLQQAAGLNKDFAVAYQVFAVSQAIINTAMGVTAALSKADFISAAIIAATGAVQIATIVSQSFAVGTGNVPYDMNAKIHKKEMIVPATFSDSIRKGDLSLSGPGGSDNNSSSESKSSIIFDFTNSVFNGITDKFVKDVFTKASENIRNKKLAILPS